MNLFLVLITVIALSLGCASRNPIRNASSPQAPLPKTTTLDTPCKYLRFSLASENPSFVSPYDVARAEIARKVELVIASEFERAGFNKTKPGKDDWLYLRAILAKSHVRPDNYVGAVEFAASSPLHRDYSLALLYGEAPVGHVGVTTAIEIPTREGRLLFPEELRSDARRLANRAYSTSAPVLVNLCRWEKQVVSEGMAVEELLKKLAEEMFRVRKASREGMAVEKFREKLVEEMVRVRRASRKAQQRRELEIGVEEPSS
jgi:hypothetical protein